MPNASDQTTATKLRDIVDDIDAVRHLIRAAQAAASSSDFHSDCGLTTLLDVIQEKLTAAGEELEMACRQNKEPANV
jgi:hypothetical protein